MSKYDHKTRERIRRRIVHLSRKGLGNIAIAKTLTAEGFKSPAGGKITDVIVASQKVNMKRKTTAAKPKTVATTASREALMRNVANSNLSVADRLTVIGLL